jgi:hypothetical protein
VLASAQRGFLRPLATKKRASGPHAAEFTSAFTVRALPGVSCQTQVRGRLPAGRGTCRDPFHRLVRGGAAGRGTCPRSRDFTCETARLPVGVVRPRHEPYPRPTSTRLNAVGLARRQPARTRADGALGGRSRAVVASVAADPPRRRKRRERPPWQRSHALSHDARAASATGAGWESCTVHTSGDRASGVMRDGPGRGTDHSLDDSVLRSLARYAAGTIRFVVVRRSRRRSQCQLRLSAGPQRWASPSVEGRGLRRQPPQSPGPGRLRVSRRPSLGRSGGGRPAAASRPARPRSPVATPFTPLNPPRGHTGWLRGRRGQPPASRSRGRPRPNRCARRCPARGSRL